LHELGAINRVTAPGGAVALAQELGERLNKVGPNALANVKRLGVLARGNDLQTQLDAEARIMADAQGHVESGEGIAAFLEKRIPDFTKFRK